MRGFGWEGVCTGGDRTVCDPREELPGRCCCSALHVLPTLAAPPLLCAPAAMQVGGSSMAAAPAAQEMAAAPDSGAAAAQVRCTAGCVQGVRCSGAGACMALHACGCWPPASLHGLAWRRRLAQWCIFCPRSLPLLCSVPLLRCRLGGSSRAAAPAAQELAAAPTAGLRQRR